MTVLDFRFADEDDASDIAHIVNECNSKEITITSQEVT